MGKPQITLKNTFRHLWKILKHKYWVLHYCHQAGITWRGIKHDMSKFSPVEFWESVRYYQGNRSPIDACKEANGYSKAWLHHKGRNQHHYEYWQDNFDNGGKPLQMPFEDAKEMLCDYLGAGRAYMGKKFSYEAEFEWWKKKCEKPLAMHPQTVGFITRSLAQLRNHPGFALEDIDLAWNYYLEETYCLEEDLTEEENG
jgi:hypothetical protein